MPRPKIDVIIPTFNARHLLEKNLPVVLKNTDNLGQLIIVDNGSTDDTVEWLELHYPNTIIIKNKTNLGYTKPTNQGVSRSHSEFLILINNDVRPEKGYDTKALRYFSNPKVFGVSFHEKGASWPQIWWERGQIQFNHGKDKSKPVLTPWVSGGSAMFRRSLWDKVGGLDEIYAPFYWEDIDISFRAWKMGYLCIWAPDAKVVHEHEWTAKQINQNYVLHIRQRNALIFNWLLIAGSGKMGEHLKHLFRYTLKHPGYIKIILLSLFRLMTHTHIQKHYHYHFFQILDIVCKPYDTRD